MNLIETFKCHWIWLPTPKKQNWTKKPQTPQKTNETKLNKPQTNKTEPQKPNKTNPTPNHKKLKSISLFLLPGQCLTVFLVLML